MNSLHTGLKTKKVYKFIGPCNRNLASCNLPMVVLLSVFSSQALANRPAMDEPHEAMQETINQAVNEPVEEMAHRPVETTPQVATETPPSSVDLIMQQQTQQTRGVLQMPAKEMQPGETIRIKVLDFPRRGMSMDKVKNEYGQPIAMSDSVGEPPITRWTYQDRIVYFEHSYVIHAVAR